MKRNSDKSLRKVYRFYKKRISSFQIHFHRAKLTGYVSDVHKARMDMKIVITLMALFRHMDHGKTFLMKEKELFDEFFFKSGKLREVQLNLKILEHYHPVDIGMLIFRNLLEIEEKKQLRNFILEAERFDTGRVSLLSSGLKKLICDLDTDRFIKCSKKFIRQKNEKIRQLQSGMQNRDNAHLIRKHLKSIATVVTANYLIRPEEENLSYLADLNRNAKILGDWHDKVVFIEAIDRFLELEAQHPGHPLTSVHQLKTKIGDECEEMFTQFIRTWTL